MSIGNAPNSLTAVPNTVTKSIDLNWFAPTAGSVSQYQIWRAVGKITPSNLPTKIATVNSNTTFYKDFSSKNNINYAYLVTATVQGKQSGNGNIVFPVKR